MALVYGSVCSGVEAATQAWHPLGWKPAFFSEIDPFPSAVLAHHYPEVPNLGDMTRFKDWPDATLDLLVGGTPCQSFSVAGLRKGLDDPRGSLMLTYLAIARRYRPRWLVWENVPGVLSADKGRAFGTLLGGMAELGYGFAYRVLDAQYVRTLGIPFAVPQRRRRVFVVGYLGDWRRAAAVLFDRESLSGNPPPRREAGQGIARGFECGPQGGGFTDLAPTLDALCKDGPIRNQIGAGVIAASPVVGSLCADTHPGAYSGQDAYTGRLVAAFGGDIARTLNARHDSSPCADRGMDVVAIQERAISENPDAGPDGVGARQDGAAYTLEARQVPQAVAFAHQAGGKQTTLGFSDDGACQTIGSHQTPAVAQPIVLMERGRNGESNLETRSDGTSNAILTPNGGLGGMGVGAIAHGWQVRRLTPRECERLQGFPDDFTRIPYRGKPAEACPDGPRYKSMGNSMAVNVMQWLGERITSVILPNTL